MSVAVPSPVDTAVAQRLRRERAQIVDNFKKEFFVPNIPDDPLVAEKLRFTQQVVSC